MLPKAVSHNVRVCLDKTDKTVILFKSITTSMKNAANSCLKQGGTCKFILICVKNFISTYINTLARIWECLAEEKTWSLPLEKTNRREGTTGMIKSSILNSREGKLQQYCHQAEYEFRGRNLSK